MAEPKRSSERSRSSSKSWMRRLSAATSDSAYILFLFYLKIELEEQYRREGIKI